MSTGKAEGSGTAVYVISVAAELSGMHAQTLRTYDRMGLVSRPAPGAAAAVIRIAILNYSARFRRSRKTMASISPASNPSSS